MPVKTLVCLWLLLLLSPSPAWCQAPPGGGAASSLPAALSTQQGAVFGGIPSGKPAAGVLPLSFTEAMKRALQYNLGATLSEQSTRAARGARMVALSELLPRVTLGVLESQQQVNLAALGFTGLPGVPPVIGPFSVFDVRAYVAQPVLNLPAIHRWRAQAENIRAAEYSGSDTRDMIVFVCGSLYLQAVAGSSRIEAARAQVTTAQALYRLATDQRAAGVSPGIEVLRAQVELQAQQQRLIVAEDAFAKDKLALARAIGLPLGQEFALTDGMSYSLFPAMNMDDATERAYRDRPDYQAALALVKEAEAARRAARAGRLPSLDLSADYGDIGRSPGSSHGAFTVAANLRIPLFQGGLIRGQVEQADAELRQRQAQSEDLRGRIYYDVRTAFLDLKAADDRVQVSQSALELASEQVQQAHDRFAAGVTGNIEVVQAQEALAAASENHISSLYAHISAKLALARALGVTAESYEQFLRGK